MVLDQPNKSFTTALLKGIWNSQNIQTFRNEAVKDPNSIRSRIRDAALFPLREEPPLSRDSLSEKVRIVEGLLRGSPEAGFQVEHFCAMNGRKEGEIIRPGLYQYSNNAAHGHDALISLIIGHIGVHAVFDGATEQGKYQGQEKGAIASNYAKEFLEAAVKLGFFTPVDIRLILRQINYDLSCNFGCAQTTALVAVTTSENFYLVDLGDSYSRLVRRKRGEVSFPQNRVKNEYFLGCGDAISQLSDPTIKLTSWEKGDRLLLFSDGLFTPVVERYALDIIHRCAIETPTISTGFGRLVISKTQDKVFRDDASLILVENLG